MTKTQSVKSEHPGKKIKLESNQSIKTAKDINDFDVDDFPFTIDVLIVDDSPTILKVISSILTKKGYYTVDVANYSKDAIEKMKKKIYDVALIDINIPELSGLELSAKFRDFESKADSFARQKIVGMTSDFGETKMQDVINAGMDSFIFKPFTVQKFEELAIMRNLLEEKKKEAEAKMNLEQEITSSSSSSSSSSTSLSSSSVAKAADTIVQVSSTVTATVVVDSSFSNSIHGNDGSTTISEKTETLRLPKAESEDMIKSPTLKAMNILIVDDSPTILKLVSRMLVKAGHFVETESTGLGALEILKSKSYDCVLMDINMPQWGGLEVSFEYRMHEYEQKQFQRHQIRVAQTNSQLLSTHVKEINQKIIAMTGEVNPRLDAEVISAGFDGLLFKPFTIEKFYNTFAAMATK